MNRSSGTTMMTRDPLEGNPGSIQALYLVVHELGAQSDGASRGVFDRYVERVAANEDLDIAAIDHHHDLTTTW